MNCGTPGSSVHGIFQVRILQWVHISSFRGSSQPRDWTHSSCVSCIASRFFTHWAMGECSWHRSPLHVLFPHIYSMSPHHHAEWVRSQLKRLSKASLVAQLVRNQPAIQETWVQSLGWEDPLEKRKGYPLQYSGLENSRTEEPGRLQSMGLQRVRHDWVTFTFKVSHRLLPPNYRWFYE